MQELLQNVLFISLAIDLLILKLHATIPPKALKGSLANAFLKETRGLLFDETPHGSACLMIIVVGIFLDDKRISSPAKISL